MSGLSTFTSDSIDNETTMSEAPPATEEAEEYLLVGSGQYQVVGIRFYDGVAHPGEYVKLIREPRNPYDRHAVRIDNLRGNKVGHLKGTSARFLAPVLDAHPHLKVEGSICGRGNKFTLPLLLEYYAVAPVADLAQTSTRLSGALAKALRMDHHFRLLSDVGGRTTSGGSATEVPAPVVSTRKLDWNQQQKALDEMFDAQLENQYKELPNVEMPAVFRGVDLFDHQIKGIKWMLKKETEANMPPFYKEVKEGGRKMYLCEITQCSQSQPPDAIRGSILCDEMGLGKTLQTLGLILLNPPPGVEYTDTPDCSEGPVIPLPSESVIQSAKVAVLKNILKGAGLKCSGKKEELRQRVLDGTHTRRITGDHFPVGMRPMVTPVVGSTNRCTLIVCPVSVMSNWQTQVMDHVKEGTLNVRIYHGKERAEMFPAIQAGTVDILLVSYHTLAADFGAVFGKGDENGAREPPQKRSRKASIFDIHFHRIVLDEAHIIRSTKTKFFKSVKEIKADRRLALTGTPIVNRADDIHSLLSFIHCQPLAETGIFRRAITQPLKNGDDIGLTRLRACMGCVSLRRSKNSVDLKLVDKEVQLCSVAFRPGAHKKTYEALFGTLRLALEAILSAGDGGAALKNYSSIFEKLLRLRQTCCSATLVAPERREVALKMWGDVQAQSLVKKLTAAEGVALLEKLKGEFTQASLPECGICLTEMEETDCIILKGCGHCFCKICIQQVFEKSNQICPYCRAPFDKADIIDKSVAVTAASAAQKELDEKECVSDDGTGDTPPKIIALLEAIQSMKPDEKGVIFSQFTKYLDLIGTALQDAGHSFVRIDGSVPARQRTTCMHAFNSEAIAPRFILCSLLAAGTGINLTRGNHCFMMDCWWNIAMENQAMDRIHRIGQQRKVHIMRFVMQDSVEERIVELQEAKSLQAKGAMQKLKGDEKRKALLGDLKGLLELKDE